MTSPTSFPRVVACLPDRAVALLVNRVLTSAGFAVTYASNLAEFEDALRFGPYRAVVTTASLRMAVREISDIPVVELAEPCPGPIGSDPGSRRLEETGLVERILHAMGGSVRPA